MIQGCVLFPLLISHRRATDFLPSRFHHSSCNAARHLLSGNCFDIFVSNSPSPPLKIRRGKNLVTGTPPPHSALSETLPYSEDYATTCLFVAAAILPVVQESFPPGGSHFRLRRHSRAPSRYIVAFDENRPKLLYNKHKLLV